MNRDDICDLLDAMQARCDAATEGPWEWRNSNGDPMLLSRAKGHYLVMGFRRMGMQGAQPVFRDRKHPGLVEEAGRENLYDFPDAELIAAARTDLPRLIAAVRAVLELHSPETYAQGPDYCAECEHRYPCTTVAAVTATLRSRP